MRLFGFISRAKRIALQGIGLVSMLLISVTVYAAGTPTIISYQGRLADSSGNLLGGNGSTFYFKFSIWDNPTVGSGAKLWPAGSPGSVSTTVRQGVFNVNIGDTGNGYPDPLTYNFNSSSDVYLQIEVSSDNASFQTLAPRQRITSAAFARLAGAVSGTETPSSFGTTTPFAGTQVSVEATSTNSILVSLRARLNQIADLFQAQDSAGNTLFSIDKTGGIFTSSFINASSTLTVTGATTLFGPLNANGQTILGNASSSALTATNLYASKFFGAGLVSSCADPAGKLLWDASTGTFSCGVDAGSGSGISAINGLSAAGQTLVAVATSTGTDFSITNNGSSAHFFSIPNASSLARGFVSTSSQSFAGTKTFTDIISSFATSTVLSVLGSLYDSVSSSGTIGQVLQSTGTSTLWVSTSSLGFVNYAYGSSTYYLASNPSSFINASALAPYSTFSYASSTFPSFSYATNTFATISSLSSFPTFTYASSTFPSFGYASSTYYLASNPNGYITNTALNPYVQFSYASSTFPSFSYATNTFATISSLSVFPTFAYASSTFPSFAYATNTFATIASLSSFPTLTYGSSTYVAITGNQTIAGNKIFSGTSTLATTTVTKLDVTGQTTLANASTSNFTASGALFVNGTSTFATTTATQLTVSGQTTLGNASSSAFTVTGTSYLGGSVLPTADVSRSIGTNAARLLNLFSQNIFASSSVITNASSSNQTVSSLFNVQGTSTLATTTASFLTSLVRLTLQGMVADSVNATGTSGQVLSSTGTSTLWTTLPPSGIANDYASSTFSSFGYASSTYYFASNPSGYITSSALNPYVQFTYASTTFPSFTYATNTFATISSLSVFPTFTYATNTFATIASLSSFPTLTYGSSTYLSIIGNQTAAGDKTFTGTSTLATTTVSKFTASGQTTLANASTTNITVSGTTYIVGDILPTTDVSRSIGTNAARILNLFSQNMFASSSVMTNATSTNFFATAYSGTNASFTNATATSLVVTGQTTLGNASSSAFTVNGNMFVSGTSSLATTTISQATVSGQTTLANASTTNLTVNGTAFHIGDILPTTDSARSIGSNSLRFLNLFSQSVFATSSIVTNGTSTTYFATNYFGTNATLATALTSNGTLTVTGQTALANASSTNLTVNGISYHIGDVLPTTDGARSLGTNALRFLNLFSQNLFASSSIITNGTSTNFFASTYSGTSATFTNATTTSLSASGQTSLANASTTNITVNGIAYHIGDILPTTNTARSIGTNTLRFLNLFSQNIFASSSVVTNASSSALTLGIGSSTAGKLYFANAGSNFTTALVSSSTQASNLIFALPGSNGNGGDVLTSDGIGNMYWNTPGAASLTGGSVGYVTRWLSPTQVGVGLFLDDGNVAGVNATSSSYAFNVQGVGSLNPFNVASSTGTSLFSVNASGKLVFTNASSTNISISNDLTVADQATFLNASSAVLTLGTGSSATGRLFFANSANNFTTQLVSSSTQASNLTFTLPGTLGNAGQVLTADGSGGLYFTTVSAVGGTSLSFLTSATGINNLTNQNFAQNWNWGTLTSQTGMTFSGGTAMTTGSVFTLGSTTTAFTHTAAETGQVASIIFSDTSTNTSGNSATDGLSIISTVNTSGAGTKDIEGINIAAPILTSCATGACSWDGIEINTQTTGAASTISQTGINIVGAGIAAGTLNGILISAITPGAGSENAINIGGGYDTAFNFAPTAVTVTSVASATGLNIDLTNIVATGLSMTIGRLVTPADTNIGNATKTGLSISSGTITQNTVSATGTYNGISLALPSVTMTVGANVTDNGLLITTPSQTQITASTTNYNGIILSTAGALTQTTAAGTINWKGLNLTAPAITGTTGTVTASGLSTVNGSITTTGTQNGISITTGAITTAGTQNGISITAAGVGAGTLNGVNISNITAGAGVENGLFIGSGWDTSILGAGALTIQSGSATNINLLAGTAAQTQNIQIGVGGAGSATPDLFVLDVKNTAGDPTAVNGAMYYNASTTNMRCAEGGVFRKCSGWTFLGTATANAVTVGPVTWTGTYKQLMVFYVITGYNGNAIGRFLMGAGSITTTGATNASSMSEGVTAPTTLVSAAGIPLAVTLSAIGRSGVMYIDGASGALKNIIIEGQNGTPSVTTAPTLFRAAGFFSDLGTNLPIQQIQLTSYTAVTGSTVSSQTFNAGTYFVVYGRNTD